MTIVVMLMGLPGSGKTTLARYLAAHARFDVISRDTIRAAMFPSCSYSAAEKHAAFDAMRTAIAITSARGVPICTDGMTFANQSDRDAIGAVCDASGAAVLPVLCDLPISVAQARVAADIQTVFPDRNPAAVSEVAARFTSAPPETFRLDMTRPTEVLGRELLAEIARRHPEVDLE